MNIDQVMQIYRAAIDPAATADEGEAWWSEVATELCEVIAAPSQRAAAAVIAWWKSEYEWNQVGDSPFLAAGRIRKFSRMVSKSQKDRYVG